ncbi:MAG: DUF3108 domain-containing protein [Pseudomonadota bacterium]
MQIRTRVRRLAALCLGALVAATPVLGNGDARQSYTISVAGLRVGTMEMAVNTSGSRYTARGKVTGGGLVGVFVNVSFDGTASGSMRGDGSLMPASYRATSGSGRKAQSVDMKYAGGTPTGASFSPPRRPAKPWDVAPPSQGGTLDPISAAYDILRDRPVGTACGRSIRIFDGARASQIRIGARRDDGALSSCAGVYSRGAGFSPKRLEEQRDFRFVIYYDRSAGEMQVTRFELDSILGQAVARRR